MNLEKKGEKREIAKKVIPRKKGESAYPELNDKEWLNSKYWGEEISAYDIADIVGCSPTAVYNSLNKQNIRIRTRDESQLGEKNHNYGMRYKSPHRKGEHNSPSTEFKKGSVPWNKGKHTEGHPHTAKAKEKIAEGHKGDKNPAKRKEVRERISKTLTGREIPKEVRDKMSISQKKKWKDPEYIKNWVRAVNAKPNKLEKLVDVCLQELQPNEWLYNGNFDAGVTIGGMIPDFVNINGKKIVIEVFSDWHDEKFMRERFDTEIGWKRTEFGRIAAYSQLGYTCIVLWEDELKNNAEGYILKELKNE